MDLGARRVAGVGEPGRNAQSELGKKLLSGHSDRNALDDDGHDGATSLIGPPLGRGPGPKVWKHQGRRAEERLNSRETMREELQLVASSAGPSNKLDRPRRNVLSQAPEMGVHCRSKSRTGSGGRTLGSKSGLQHQTPLGVPGGRLMNSVATILAAILATSLATILATILVTILATNGGPLSCMFGNIRPSALVRSA